MIRAAIGVTLFIFSAVACAVQAPVVEVSVNSVGVTVTCTPPDRRKDNTILPINQITGYYVYWGRLDDLGDPSVFVITGNVCSAAILIETGNGVYQFWLTTWAGQESQPSDEVQLVIDILPDSPPVAITDLAAGVQ